jgi:GNAT superfamily N-acetyltransferase
VVLARDGETIVGASTALPLSDAEPEFQRPFRDVGLDPEDYFYFGESVLQPEYRGQKAGVKFFEEREAQAHFLGFPFSCFCAVVRPEDHPARPADYRALDRLWSRRGFTRRPDLHTTFSWLDLGQTQATDKVMEFWVRREDAEF